MILEVWPWIDLLISKVVGFPIQWHNMQILFKFQVNQMKNDNFRNLTQVVHLGPTLTFFTFWPQKTIGFFLITNSTMWWSFVKIGLKLWPVGDWETDKRTEYQNRLTNILEKSSILQGSCLARHLFLVLSVCLPIASRSQF